jgi:hypothetical protein
MVENRNVHMINNILLMVLGTAGMIVFFPYNFDNTHTCLAHKYVERDISSCCEELPGDADKDHCNPDGIHSGENHHLMSHYLYPFAFLWWTSIGLVVLQVRNIALRRKQVNPRHKGKLT